MANRKTPGLRLLWIPGRKKNHHKGRMETTRLTSVQMPHQQKKNEPWSLGGSKGQEELIKSLVCVIKLKFISFFMYNKFYLIRVVFL